MNSDFSLDQDPEIQDTPKHSGFEGLGLSARTLKTLALRGFEEPTKIQADVIPILLQGENDVIGQSYTGTGKTAAFGLPLLEKLKPAKGPVQALVLVPTRELAIQVAEELNSLRGENYLHIVPVYGGQSYEQQFRHFRQGVDILVGTPGRTIDHLQRRSLNLSTVKYVVLDEADEMLDMGFIDDIEAILGMCAGRERMLLFSATMPPRIRNVAETWMTNPKTVTVTRSTMTTALTEQLYYEVFERDKFEALCRIMDIEKEFYGMVFCRTKVECDTVHTRLLERGYDSDVLHGDISQQQREKTLDKFRKKLITVLVATDVAARGIDVSGLTHVINFSLPADPESYVHRIGRTGRAGKEGTAITFVSPEEFRKLRYIQNISKSEIKREQVPTVDAVLARKREVLLSELDKLIGTSKKHARVLSDDTEFTPEGSMTDGVSANGDDAETGAENTEAEPFDRSVFEQDSRETEVEQESKLPAAFEELADDVLARTAAKGRPVKTLVAALLYHTLRDELDASRYAHITDIRAKSDRGFDRNGRGDRFERGGRNDRFDRGARGDRFERGGRGRGFDNRGFGGDRGFQAAGNDNWSDDRQTFAGQPVQVNGDAERLYVARGKADGFSKPKLVELIRAAANVRDRDIDQVEVFDFYSFITVPKSEVGRIIDAFQPGGNGERMMPGHKNGKGGKGPKAGKAIVRRADPDQGPKHSRHSH